MTEHPSDLDYLDEAISRFSAEIAQLLQDEADAITLLDTIPGASQRMEEVMVAEIETDLTHFPSAKHLA